MLKTFREKIVSWGAKLLFGILILSFGMWGIGDYISTPNPSTSAVAEVGDMEVTGRELEIEVSNQLARFRDALGTNLDMEQAKAMGLVDSALETMVQRNLVALGARDLGLMATEEIIAQEIRSDPRFQGPLGEFDRRSFDDALRQIGRSEDDYVNLMREDLLRRQLLSPITTGVAAPDSLTRPIYSHRNQRRVAELIKIDHDSLADPGQPDAATLEAYHESNARRFTAPEFRAFTLAELKAEDLVDEVHVPEEEIKAEYEARLDQYFQPERRKLRQILVADENTIRQAAGRLGEGADFATVAKEVAGLNADDIDLGEMTRAQVPVDELADAAFSLAVGASSQPIRTDLGWHIVHVDAVTPERQKSLDEVRDELRRGLAEYKAVDALYDLSNRFEDALGGGASVAEAARQLNIPTRKISGASAGGVDPDGEQVEGLDPGGVILRTAFETEEGQDSALTDLGETGYFILHVDRVTPPKLRPLSDIREQVAAAWKREQRAKAAETKAADMVEKLKSGFDPAELATEVNSAVVVTKPFTRDGDGLDTEMPGALISQMFELDNGAAAWAPGNGAHYVGRLAEVMSSSLAASGGGESGEDGLAGTRAQLEQALTNDLTLQLTRALRDRHGVTVNRNIINRLF